MSEAMSTGDRFEAFASDVARDTVCYATISNTKVAVIVPTVVPENTISDVLHIARGYDLVATQGDLIDGDVFGVGLEFAPLEVIGFGGVSEDGDADG